MKAIQTEQYNMLNFVNGEWIGKDLPQIRVINPANGQDIGSVPQAGAAETKQAIEAAHQALPDWKALSAGERADYLKRIHHLMLEKQEELARLMTLEMGKPLRESRGEVKYAAAFLEWFAEEGKRVYGRTIPGRDAKQRIQVLKQPVGVVAAITPWNFPSAMITRKMAPALAAGCTFVVKPPRQTPFSAIILMEICQEAGLPKGVVNLVTGKSSEISDTFMNDARVRKITFTGSTEVGKSLIEKSAKHVKNVSMELGGHAPLIVMNDADVDKAVQAGVASKYRNGGQTCICANRLYIQSGVYDRFAEAFADAVRQLNIGDGFDEETDIGPVIDRDGYEKIECHVQDARDKGAEVLVGGSGKSPYKNAYYYEPTVLKNATEHMLIMEEETFGPVAPLVRFETAEEAIRLANNNPYGLAAYVFTESVTQGTLLTEALEYGIIGWNDGVPSAVQAPFGGMKESGMGREGGTEGIEAFLETKYVSLGL